MFPNGRSCLVIGISGATCSGKTTLANALHKMINNSIALNQDQFYWNVESENHKLAEGMDHINWELVSAFDNEKLLKVIDSNINTVSTTGIQQFDGEFTLKKFNALTKEIEDLPERIAFFENMDAYKELVVKFQKLFTFLPKVIIIDGILVLNQPQLLNVCDIKFFATLDYTTCLERRKLRSYDPPDVPGYFEKIVYPYYLKNMENMRKLDISNEILYLDGSSDILINFKIIVAEIIRKIDKIPVE